MPNLGVTAGTDRCPGCGLITDRPSFNVGDEPAMLCSRCDPDILGPAPGRSGAAEAAPRNPPGCDCCDLPEDPALLLPPAAEAPEP